MCQCTPDIRTIFCGRGWCQAPNPQDRTPQGPVTAAALLGTAYVIGPMTGLSDKNYPAFWKAAAWLRSLGFEVVSPAELNPDEVPWEEAMRKDIAHLVLCQTVALLPGWQHSRGANREVSIADDLRMHRLHVPPEVLL